MFTVTITLAAAALIVVVLAMGIVQLQQPDSAFRARALTWVAACVMAAFTVLAGLFIGSFALNDPGGSAGVGLILSWAVPMAALAVLAWLKPGWASRALLALTATLLAASVWFAVDSQVWRELENQNGPIRTVAVLVLAFPAAVLGLKRTTMAAWLLLVLGFGPIAVCIIGSLAGVVALSAISVIPLITGVLYLISGWMMRAATDGEPVRAATACSPPAP